MIKCTFYTFFTSRSLKSEPSSPTQALRNPGAHELTEPAVPAARIGVAILPSVSRGGSKDAQKVEEHPVTLSITGKCN